MTLKLKRRKNYATCKGPFEENCEQCPKLWKCLDTHLKWYSSIPHFILDKYLPELSPSAFKIFVFLNRSADFDPTSKHFGRCWFKYEQIEKATGVAASNMRKYIDELKGKNLIRHKVLRFVKNNRIRTSHHFTVTWLKEIRELRYDAKKVLRKKRKNR